jgi:hypothetical protein
VLLDGKQSLNKAANLNSSLCSLKWVYGLVRRSENGSAKGFCGGIEKILLMPWRFDQPGLFAEERLVKSYLSLCRWFSLVRWGTVEPYTQAEV